MDARNPTAFPRFALGLFAMSAVANLAAWWWLGRAEPLPPVPIGAGEKLSCLSYAPFRGRQSPLNPATRIEAWQIEEDLAGLTQITDCVRIYSVRNGLEKVPEIARRHGLKVLLGLWLGREKEKNRLEIEGAITLARQFGDVVQAVIVGNEVLLRGEMSASDLADVIRGVKAQVPVPVTYADVWEFWLRHAALREAVDFVTIHILPYWEDFPIPAKQAAAHLDSIRRKVAAAFPGKEILIGETGWPSQGRMREGALPSPINQARVLHETAALAKREKFRINVIEAFDQPWKRLLEGTVGGHWGLFDAEWRAPKFAWGAPLSDHPFWKWQAALGLAFAAAIFAAALGGGRTAVAHKDAALIGVALNAAFGGILIGLVAEKIPLESLGAAGWARSLSLAGLALAAPLLASAALTRRVGIPSFAQILARAEHRVREPLALGVGLTLIILTLLAIHAALGLVFDPRYRDFPFAPLTAAVVPFFVLSVAERSAGPRATAEIAAAGALALAALYIAFNEGFANWQALWLCAALLLLALTLWRVRAAPG